MMMMMMCVCVCVCVCERERERYEDGEVSRRFSKTMSQSEGGWRRGAGPSVQVSKNLLLALCGDGLHGSHQRVPVMFVGRIVGFDSC